MSQRKQYTAMSAASDVEATFKLLEGRWKLAILFQLFDGQVRRFSDLERLLPGVTKKMLTQQLKGMEKEGIVVRTAYPGFPLRVDYRISAWGKTLCPVMDSLLQWYEQCEEE